MWSLVHHSNLNLQCFKVNRTGNGLGPILFPAVYDTDRPNKTKVACCKISTSDVPLHHRFISVRLSVSLNVWILIGVISSIYNIFILVNHALMNKFSLVNVFCINYLSLSAVWMSKSNDISNILPIHLFSLGEMFGSLLYQHNSYWDKLSNL